MWYYVCHSTLLLAAFDWPASVLLHWVTVDFSPKLGVSGATLLDQGCDVWLVQCIVLHLGQLVIQHYLIGLLWAGGVSLLTADLL
jgi:hypothetical protein